MADNEIKVHMEGQQLNVNKVESVDAPNVPEVYANNVIPAITSFDVTLHFGSIVNIENGVAKVARRVSIVLTPEIAKLLHLQLDMGLKNYEQNVRQIHLSVQPTVRSSTTDSPTDERTHLSQP
jgi:hypothetical protein